MTPFVRNPAARRSTALLWTCCIAIFMLLPLSQGWASTVAIISGSATPDGRPLLMKLRDNADNPNQEYIYLNDGIYPYIGVTYADLTNQVWGGVNSVGFCIVNSNAWNFGDSAAGADDDGFIIRQALRSCQTVADFQLIMDSTNIVGRTRPANYGVVDASGAGAFFEAATYNYYVYNLSDSAAAPNGYMVRANFGYSGSSYHLGQHRHDRALELLNWAYYGGFLTHQYVIQSMLRDLVNEDTNPYPLPFEGREGLLPYGLLHTHEALNRDISRSAMVIQGILPGEDPLLSLIWALVGEPISTTALPLWVKAASTPVQFDSVGGSPLNLRAQQVRDYLYQQQWASDALDTWLLLDDRGQGSLPFIEQVENTAIARGDSALAVWRSSSMPQASAVASFQNSLAGIAYAQLLSWGPPQAPQVTATWLTSGSVSLNWAPITHDVFGRPFAVSGYTVYGAEVPFYNRLTGDSLTTVISPPITLSAPQTKRFFQVRARH